MSWIKEKAHAELARIREAKDKQVYPFFRPFETGGLRTTVAGTPLINFSSNDYLGLTTHPRVKEAAIWGGIAMIVLSGFLFDGAALFPGVATLWPVAGTLLALFGASRDTPPGFAAAVLSTPPVEYLAKISYQLYLWHWPVLVFYLQLRGRDRVGLVGAAAILAASFALAAATQWVVSRRWIVPPRGTFRWRAVLAPALAVAMLATVTVGWSAARYDHEREQLRLAEQLPEGHIGALALTDPQAASAMPSLAPLPDFDAAYGDRPAIYGQGCVQSSSDAPGAGEVTVCDVDDYGGRKTVVLTGGSHAVQWYPAVRRIAEDQGWHLLVIEKNGCRLTTNSRHPACVIWNESAVDVIASYSPDLVLTVGSVTSAREDVQDRIVPDTVAVWQQLAERGIPVVGIRDTPRPPFAVPACLQESGGDVEQCSVPRAGVFADDLFAEAENLPASFELVDLSDAICGPEACAPVVGNVVVYRDASHLTASYVRTLTPMLEAAMRAARSDLFIPAITAAAPAAASAPAPVLVPAPAAASAPAG